MIPAAALLVCGGTWLVSSLVSCRDEPREDSTNHGAGTPARGRDAKTDQPGPAQPGDVALELGGVKFTRGQIDPLVDYFRELDPTLGRNKVVREILDQHLIPVAFLQSDFGPEISEQRRHAEDLAASLGQAAYDDLVDQGKRMPGFKLDQQMARSHLPIPEQQWLFDDLKVGRVSPVLISARGFSIVAASSKTAGPTKAYDHADVCRVRFDVLDRDGFAEWYHQLRERLRRSPAIVHADFRDALPPWINTRRQQ